MVNDVVTVQPTNTVVTEDPLGAPPPTVAPTEVPKVLAPPVAKPPVALSEDTDPTDGESYVVKGDAMKKRLERAKAQALKAMFGTDDPEEAKAKLAEYEQLKSKSEEQRRAQLSEAEKLKEDLARLSAERDQAKQEAQRIKERVEVSKVGKQVRSLAIKHIDPTMVQYAELEFQAFCKRLGSPKEINRLTPKDISNFFEKLAKKQPKFSRNAPVQVAPKTQVPITNGNPKKVVPTASKVTASQKTAKPNQPNSKSMAEIRQEGYDF